MKKQDYVIRILDDDEEFLDAINFLLTTEGWKTAVFSSASEFLSNIGDAPGCIILDVRMPVLSGPEVQAQLIEKRTRLPIVFLTGHGNLDLAVHVFRSGAWDFLQKPITKTALLTAIERAIAEDDKRREVALQGSPLGRWQLLTQREKEIVRDVGLFLSNKAIAEKRGISERTVESHRASALKKLGIHKPSEIAQLIRALSGMTF